LTSLCEHERITTTLAKARAVRKKADRLITIGKREYLTEERRKQMIEGRLHTEEAVAKVVEELVPRFDGMQGNYCYITPAGRRKGDGAKLAVIQYKYNPMALYEQESQRDTTQAYLTNFTYKLLVQEKELFQGKLDALQSELMDPLKAGDKEVKAKETFFQAQLAVVERELTHFAVTS
jgi:large subunit ribosomal protein L17